MTCSGGGGGSGNISLLVIRGPCCAVAVAFLHLPSVVGHPPQLSEPDQSQRIHPQRACLEIERKRVQCGVKSTLRINTLANNKIYCVSAVFCFWAYKADSWGSSRTERNGTFIFSCRMLDGQAVAGVFYRRRTLWRFLPRGINEPHPAVKSTMFRVR